ncbi:MbtH family NRPS accessory protein [Streptacidiphilus sp. P02-A3a]|uniref:MbtH family protein n=1 Tax=Streptacidiphilus sp. P02-A3a TaxID=2704468 RepID=UPI00272D1958|nr:MbtH family NRPS accessory protein [Streptacidiphilus sp. P02-A3a]QMU74131.1 MbtH family NRPS accessory protein [Streptacidiphilus sp. P02-A3a]
MSNPFENTDGVFLVLKNAQGQHSLWPEQIEVPLGWDVVCGPSDRAVCVAYVDQHWTDLRPASLILDME